ncbi:MAG: amidohydrolase family protein [Phenylobacterium sp.]
MSDRLILRNVEVEGRPGLDVELDGGRITAIGARLPRGGPELDGGGGALIPGLIDHHIHLLALAAQAQSVRLDDVRSPHELAARLGSAAAARRPGTRIRATGYHEHTAGLLSATDLDGLAPRHPLRVQHRTGGLWMLNSLALAEALRAEPPPDCVELDEAGRPTGRIWRGDAWLSARLGRAAPPLDPVGAALAACGITGVTDTSATNDVESAAVLAAAVGSGELPQRVMLMSGGELAAPSRLELGPVKVLLDEDSLPDIDAFVARIALAREWGRCVAVHCVTAAELGLTLAAFKAAGARPGDRIEHGSVIPGEAMPTIAALGLTVVTQPGFVFERGDRYLADVAPEDRGDLYRIQSLRVAGVAVAASSDAPYGGADPWVGVRAAMERRTQEGRSLGAGEALSAQAALSLYLGDFARPGGAPRRVAVGAPADLCLLRLPLTQALRTPEAGLVAATLVGGRLIFERTAEPA